VSEFISELASTADSESPRTERARAVAEMIRSARNYRWLGIYDVDDDDVALIGDAGESPAAEAARSRATVVGGAEIVVPILGAESGIVIGTIDAQRERLDASVADDVAFLEECAAALRPLYD
jgi:putative methionine-R-sulfoxide reductase with GAF domain